VSNSMQEQHVQPPQPDGIDGEEVAGQDSGGLLAKKRPPAGACPPWRGVEAVAAKRLADRGRGDLDTKQEQLALDPLVAPTRVLGGQADDQPLQLLVEWRAASSTAGIGPGTGDQSTMPAQQGLGLDEEARPAGSWQHAADGGKQGPIGGL
jgi:hypothetical protein